MSDEQEAGVDMDVVVAKVLTIVVITSLTVIVGLLPCRLVKHFRRKMLRTKQTIDKMVSGAKCFSGGVFLGVCLLHLIPETRKKVDSLLEQIGSTTTYPVAELLTMVGFFGVIFGEHTIRFLYVKTKEDWCLPSSDNDSYSFDQEYGSNNGDLGAERCDLIECRSLRSISNHSHLDADETPTAIVHSVSVTDESVPVARMNVNGLYPINQTITECFESTRANNAKNTIVTTVTVDTDNPKYNTATADELIEECPETRRGIGLTQENLQDLEVKTVVTEISRSEDTSRGHIQSAFLLVALSFHGVFEGMALGLQVLECDVWVMCVAIVIHRIILAFGMSLQYARNNDRASTIVFSISTFSIICVVGIVIGIVISAGAQLYSDVNVPNAILQSLATGTIFYIVFLNILYKELDGNRDVKKISCTFVGFVFMAITLAVAKG
ncbi:zinc transporter ZIP1-like [Dreissena polymorpha]|uniref:Uncharacterized protein n=1 Tax=Dreissena polymorpha TaxID=45954 RepID=A0A9D4I2Q6_DREPO|nr:zinc transporter ZIP1-like [Dreissena polymorpha]KAH3741547.1 hypothetical protein DPMN_048272 [Dreissena polymorpha]